MGIPRTADKMLRTVIRNLPATVAKSQSLYDFSFLGAIKLLYNWLCPSVGWLDGWLVGRLVGLSVPHSFDDPHVAPYWPTWPCFPLIGKY